MATVKPIVQYDSGLEELRSGDTLPGSGGGGGGNACTAIVDFASGQYDAQVDVTGQAWVTSSSVVIANAIGEDARVECITCNVGALVDGVGFTVYAHAPNGAVGQYTINCIGV